MLSILLFLNAECHNLLSKDFSNVAWQILGGNSWNEYYVEYTTQAFSKVYVQPFKRCKVVKFQSTITPDGLLAFICGLVTGNLHTSFLLSNSDLLNKFWGVEQACFLPFLICMSVNSAVS